MAHVYTVHSVQLECTNCSVCNVKSKVYGVQFKMCSVKEFSVQFPICSK